MTASLVASDYVNSTIGLHEGFAQLKSFPGGTYKELLYYVEPTLKDKIFDLVLLHVGVNDLLKSI